LVAILINSTRNNELVVPFDYWRTAGDRLAANRSDDRMTETAHSDDGGRTAAAPWDVAIADLVREVVGQVARSNRSTWNW
jgi:hypothetical protein